MIRRIIYAIVWLLCFPLIFPAAFFTALVMYPLGGLRWLIFGSDYDDTFEWMFAPFMWVVELPHKIMGEYE